MPRSCTPKRPNNSLAGDWPWHVACYFTGMNATPPISQPQFGNDASQINATATNSAAIGAHNQDFAKALNDAGAKPSRKTTAHTSAGVDPSGSHLPVAGKSSPSPLPPPPPAAGAPAAGSPAAGSAALAPAPAATAASAPPISLPPSSAGSISVTAPVGSAGATAQPAAAEAAAASDAAPGLITSAP